jgi:hypothetical protein
MHNGETIQKLAAAVDKIHERHSGNAVKTVFTNTPRPWSSEQMYAEAITEYKGRCTCDEARASLRGSDAVIAR